jgi:hypothetical protein
MKSLKRIAFLLFLFDMSAAYAQDSMTAGAVVKRYNGGVQISGQFTVPNAGMFGGACLAAQLEQKTCATDQDCGVAPDGGYAYCAQSDGSPFVHGPQPARMCWVRPGPPTKFCRNSATLAGVAAPGQPPRPPVALPQGLNQTPWVRPPTEAVWTLLTRDGKTNRQTRLLGPKLRWTVIVCTNRNWTPSPDPANKSPCSSTVPLPNKVMDMGETTLVNAVEYKPEAVIIPDTKLKPGQLNQ